MPEASPAVIIRVPRTKQTMRVQRTKSSDFLPIAALDRVAWRHNAHSEFVPDGEHVWRIWCEHALTFAAWSDAGELVGGIVAFPCLDGTYCLHKVIVAESQRGQGVGAKLFEALFAELDTKGVDCFLTVDPANENARKLYRKWGFTREKFVAGFYREQEDRFVLTRPAQAS